MTVRLSIAIMHVPDDPLRRAMLARIERALAPELGGVEGYRILRDIRREGVWPMAKRTWMSHSPQATHHLLLQDDMLPCRDFIEGLKAAIVQRPKECITLFSMRAKIIAQARERGVHWYTCPNNVWGGAVVLPLGDIAPFLAWCAAHIPEEFPHDDSRLSLYLMKHKRKVWTTIPSLVEHIGAAHSLLGHHNPRRVASWYLGEQSACSIDWSKGKDDPVCAPGSGCYASAVYYE